MLSDLLKLLYFRFGYVERIIFTIVKCFTFFLISGTTYAEEQIDSSSIAVRDVLSAQGEWQFDIDYLYSNNQSTTVHSGGGIGVIQSSSTTTENSSLTKSSSDILIISPALRYGLTSDTEIAPSISWQAYQTRTQERNAVTTESGDKLTSLNLAVNHRFTNNGARSAVIGSFNLNLAENVGKDNEEIVYGRAWSASVTGFRVYDPVVMSVAVGYQEFLQRNVDGDIVNPGEIVFVNGGINFAANSDLSLKMGFTWTYTSRNEINGQKQGIAVTTTSLGFGFGYEWSVNTLVFFAVNTVVSGGEGATISLNTSYYL
ncbi:MAG: hypothetical protein OEY52_01685 [Gammaproteobacteria bacterium]|nr:hypothetical protein [Gammaproteobacteria bacterium]